MTVETAQAIVNGVALRHPKLKPQNIATLDSGWVIVEFETLDVDPKTIAKWFQEYTSILSFNVGRNVLKRCMYLYFREATS